MRLSRFYSKCIEIFINLIATTFNDFSPKVAERQYANNDTLQ